MNEIIWRKSQYQENWLSGNVNQINGKILSENEKAVKTRCKASRKPKPKRDAPNFCTVLKPIIHKVDGISLKPTDIRLIYATKIFKTLLLSLKFIFDHYLKMHCEQTSNYVGQTGRSTATWRRQHEKTRIICL